MENLGTGEVRTAKEVIDQAINENRLGQWLLYVFAGMFVIVGLSVLVYGMIRGEAVIAASGTVASVLFWPAMNSARRTRRESIAIRLLEVPLSRADTAKEASEMLQRLFDEIFSDRRRDG